MRVKESSVQSLLSFQERIKNEPLWPQEGGCISNPNAKTELLLITPQIAAEMLKRNIENRPISNARIDKYAQDIKSGRWKVTHQGIAFDKNNTLIDGQHRLKAIVKADSPAYLNVSTGMDTDTFDVLDTGGNRSKSDVLSIAGLPPRVARIIGAAIPYCVTYEDGKVPARSLPKKYGNSNQATLEYFQANPDLIDSAFFVTKMPRRDAILKESISCFLHYQIRRKGYDDADDFLTQLLTGAYVPTTSAVFEIRKVLLASRLGSHRLIESIIINKTIAAYNYFHKGQYLKDPRQALYRFGSETIVRIA